MPRPTHREPGLPKIGKLLGLHKSPKGIRSYSANHSCACITKGDLNAGSCSLAYPIFLGSTGAWMGHADIETLEDALCILFLAFSNRSNYESIGKKPFQMLGCGPKPPRFRSQCARLPQELLYVAVSHFRRVAGAQSPCLILGMKGRK